MIEIKNLTKSFGSLTAVNDLNLHVPAGELFCFLGPNGAGKTTTIKILTGLMAPTSGSCSVGGIDIQTDPVDAKKLIGYIPDTPYLYERLTTTEFFKFIGDLYCVPEDQIESEMEKFFDIFGLLQYRNSLIRELSHGLRQRLLYSTAFLHNPKVLFVDEPLIGLDPYTIRLIKELLKEYTRDGMTIFLTSHILALVQDIADRIGIIAHGKLIALGTLDELLEEHKSNNLEDLFLQLTNDGDAG